MLRSFCHSKRHNEIDKYNNRTIEATSSRTSLVRDISVRATALLLYLLDTGKKFR